MKEVIMRVASFSADYPKAPIYVADLVRCKECKYYEAKEDWCYWRDEYTEPEYFCSYGEVCDE